MDTLYKQKYFALLNWISQTSTPCAMDPMYPRFEVKFYVTPNKDYDCKTGLTAENLASIFEDLK